MTAEDVLEVLALLDGTGAWVDGGWGVDALAGRQTREHGDLDLVVPADRLDEAVDRLRGADFRPIRDLLPTALALQDGSGREVDLHPVTPESDGGGTQDLSGDPSWTGPRSFRFGPPAAGSIGGVPLRCTDATTQRRAHEGYEQRDVDRHDLALLNELG